MKRFLGCIVITSAVSGCAVYDERISNIELDPGRTAVFKIPASLLSGEKPDRLPSRYADALRYASTYVPPRSETVFSGVRITPSGNEVTVSYMFQSGSRNLRNNFTAKFLLDITNVGDAYSVVATCPSNVEHDFRWPNTWSPFNSKEQAIADLNSLCSNAAFVFDVTENGEVNTSFNDSPVFANFQRKLKSFKPSAEIIKQYDLQKSAWFNFQDGGKNYEVALSVFPYRNGSKVLYKNIRRVTCRASKPCDLDAGFGDRLRAMITSIANE